MNNILNFFKARGEDFACLPLVAIDTAIEAEHTIIGIAASVLSLVSLGNNNRINDYADRTIQAAKVLPYLYKGTMKIINPYAYIKDPEARVYFFYNSKTYLYICLQSSRR